MSIIVSFMRPGSLGSLSVVGVGACRAAEVLTLSSGVTTSGSAQQGEIAMIVSTETATVRGARGTTPDAATTTATAASDACFALPPGVPVAVALSTGDKLNFKP